LQHSLAWLIDDHLGHMDVRLERPVETALGRISVDVWCRGSRAALELKYVTARLDLLHDHEDFRLKAQDAYDHRRYDFLKDISRLEVLLESGDAKMGYAVLLTNASALWETPGRANSNDIQFRIHQGRTLEGQLSWSEGTGAGSMRSREAAIVLSGRYRMEWQDYSNPGCGKNGAFRYLAVEVA